MNKYIFKKINQEKTITFLIYFVLFTFSLIFSFITIKAFAISGRKYILILMFLLILIALIEFKIFRRKGFKLEHVFLMLVLPIGAFYLICIPPSMVSDEGSHMNRSYVISEGNIFSKKNSDGYLELNVPSALEKMNSINYNYNILINEFDVKTDYKDKTIASNDSSSAGTYNFVSYIGSSFGIFLGRTFNINIIFSYYLARIFNFLIAIIILFHSIRLIPFAKLFVLIYTLTPMFLQQLSGVSADTILNALSIFMISFILYIKYEKQTFDNKDKIIYALCCFVITLIKYAYFPMIFLIFILDKNKLFKNKENRRYVYLVLIFSIFLSIIFYFFNSVYYDFRVVSYAEKFNLNSGEQLKWIFNNPIGYLRVIINTLNKNLEFYYFTFLGRNIGNYTLEIKSYLIIFLSFIMYSSIFVEKRKINIKRKDIIIFLIIFSSIFMIIETGLYLSWTEVGAGIIEGVHGRYFIPIIVLLGILLTKIDININSKYVIQILIGFIILIQFLSIYSIIAHYNFI